MLPQSSGGTEGGICPRLCSSGALCATQGKRMGGRQTPLPAPGNGERRLLSDCPSRPRRAAWDPLGRPRSHSAILQLAFNWFLSIKLNTDNRLISAIKCLKFLTTQSIRWKKHNNVSLWIAWDSSRTLDLKTEVYGGENADGADSRAQPPSATLSPVSAADPGRPCVRSWPGGFSAHSQSQSPWRGLPDPAGQMPQSLSASRGLAARPEHSDREDVSLPRPPGPVGTGPPSIRPLGVPLFFPPHFR